LNTSGAANLSSAAVANNATVGGTLGVTGNTSLSTLSTSGAATLNSANVTNNAAVGGTLGVTGALTASGGISTTTLSASGAATLNSAAITNNATVGGALGVTGNTTLSTLSTSGLATLSSVNVTNNAAVGGSLTAAGGVSTTTLTATGAATLDSANITNNTAIGGALAVTGATTLSTLSTSGLATLNSASIANNATIGGTLGVTGATTLGGATTVNNTLTVDSNGAAAGGSTLAVDGAGVSMAAGANSLTVDAAAGTTIVGNTTINGNLVVSGTITGTNSSAVSGIQIGNNGINIDGPTNTVTIVADDNNAASDGRGILSVNKTEASLTVVNAGTGVQHGLVVGQTSTVLSGGTASTSLTLDDNGASFADTATGGPVRVTGVADGKSPYDAVNVRQLDAVAKKAYGGIASVAALAGIPDPIEGKNVSFGVGYGNYSGQQAVAFGARANIAKMVRVTAGLGFSSGRTAASTGIGISW
jgi:hypothetical protein